MIAFDSNILIVGACTFVAYRIWIVVYNLYLSPLAQFPGPKFAAVSYLPEFYYNLIAGEGGQFPFIVREWHDKYGPIIRINPHELHVRDSSWFDTLYNNSRPAWKIQGFGVRFQTQHTAGGTENPALFRPRRAALNPFFSRRRVAQDTPRFQKNAARAMQRVEQEYGTTGNVLHLNSFWGCYAADNLVNTCFDQDVKFLESPDFRAEANEATVELLQAAHVFYHFPILMFLMKKMPDRIMLWLNPSMAPLLKFWEVRSMLATPASAQKEGDRTIFSSLLQGDLPPEELSFDRLHQESVAIIGAGVETTARSLTIACFHITDQPAIRERLVAELCEAAPDETAMPDWDALVKLPYLSACVEEAIRLTYGLSQRRARGFFDGPLIYKDWVIPPGVFVGMDNWDVAHDENIFPNSHSYIPERWLGEPLAPDGRPLKAYQAAFGKGSRSCIGMHLAYAELYIGIGQFFRSPLGSRAMIHESDQSDLELVRDHFVPRARASSEGIRMKFRSSARGGEYELP
ncbi:hypothetical protein CERZMDRAFT_108251 [Cercospora zeae-maydis SCOH1-5]|uniref:Trichodiene oxygenase n=1 Tax=Cercospora zeae-maydis SCOH1-5 TaxID=717836 RepID=A0A6A6FVX4_9PEZI|nr:hypothetical protein CERZMDRAFT_108251 [Cercospora zeae-maydis SCOH1-5]